jgi:hypothetical protein
MVSLRGGSVAFYRKGHSGQRKSTTWEAIMKRLSIAIIGAFVLVALAPAAEAQSGVKLQTTEFQVTFDANGHSTPMIGIDSISDFIVYSEWPVVNGAPGNAAIYYQRVASGQAFGQPVAVANSPANQWLDAVSGDNIVYTVSPSIGAYGNIILYEISTAQAQVLTTAGNAWEPYIYGPNVVWIELPPSGGGPVPQRARWEELLTIP